jgi:hypothetical protein
MIKRNDYPLYYDCIVTDQMHPSDIAELLEDKGFKKYWNNKKKLEKGIFGAKRKTNSNQ